MKPINMSSSMQLKLHLSYLTLLEGKDSVIDCSMLKIFFKAQNQLFQQYEEKSNVLDENQISSLSFKIFLQP